MPSSSRGAQGVFQCFISAESERNLLSESKDQFGSSEPENLLLVFQRIQGLVLEGSNIVFCYTVSIE